VLVGVCAVCGLWWGGGGGRGGMFGCGGGGGGADGCVHKPSFQSNVC